MTKTMATGAAVSIGVAALVGLLFGESVSPVTKAGEWARLVVTVMALLLGGYIIWQNRSQEALQDSVTALKTAVDSHKLESEALSLRLASVSQERSKLEAEIITLRAKTDMGEVLRLLTVMTSNTFSTLERHEQLILQQTEVLKDVQRKVNGWKVERRESLRDHET